MLDVAQLASRLGDSFISPEVFPLGSCLGNNEMKSNDAQRKGFVLKERCARAGKRARGGGGYIAGWVWVMGKRARVPGCKYTCYTLGNLSMAARMEGIMRALKGDIENVG